MEAEDVVVAEVVGVAEVAVEVEAEVVDLAEVMADRGKIMMTVTVVSAFPVIVHLLVKRLMVWVEIMELPVTEAWISMKYKWVGISYK